ncbi:hypothetical protein [Paenibacillus lutrae]|uniref:Uncharacterized protein n=1 Tax=Paenibacillus lutrae TaxID=2078573 RepID=A0A7X3FFW2_9BACL|nr:hypothetical protein [Paenibacillus lutrae]MVO98832.1 hypothetical protein [Paenibacillus lutrae]
MNEKVSKFAIATAILIAPAAGTALEASAQVAAVQSQSAAHTESERAATAALEDTAKLDSTVRASSIPGPIQELTYASPGFSPNVIAKTPM